MNFANEAAIIVDCLAFSADMKCVRCTLGKYLANDRASCVDACDFGHHKEVTFNDATSGTQNLAWNMC